MATPTKKTPKVSMDDMLKYLDKDRASLGTWLVKQEAGWVEVERAKIIKDHKAHWADLIEQIRKYGKKSDPKKAEKIAVALESTEYPQAPVGDHPPEVDGRWHHEIVVSRRDGKEKLHQVSIGMCDYRLSVKQHSVYLSDYDFMRNLQEFAMEDDEAGRSVFADRFVSEEKRIKRISTWLRNVTVDACRTGEGKEFKITETDPTVKIFVFSLPQIKDLSVTIKRLRKFTDELPSGTVYVCTPSDEHADTLIEQGIGWIQYPTGKARGWPMRHQAVNSAEASSHPSRFETPW